MMERLFLLWLGRVEGDIGGGFDISNRDCFLGTWLVHGDGSRVAFAICGILRLRE